MATKLVTYDDIALEIHLDQPIAILGAAWPVGSIHISVSPTNPAISLGFGTWVAFGTGRVLIGLDATNPQFDVVEEIGGALTVPATGTNSAPVFTGTPVASEAISAGTPTGSNSAPTFTGSSASTGAVSAGTPTGSVAAPTFTGNAGIVPAQVISWPAGVPAFTGAAFSGVINHIHAVSIVDPGHTHTIQMQGSATPATTGIHIVNSTAVGGSSRVAASPDQANSNTSGITATTSNPASSVASITPAGTIAWPVGVPVNATSTFTPTGSNSAPAFTGNAMGTHVHTLTATGTISAPIFTGSALPTHQHNVTPAGTVSAPAFTGTPSSVVQPYIVVFMWKRIT